MQIINKKAVQMKLHHLQKERTRYLGAQSQFSSQQVQFIQEMVDTGVDWVTTNSKLNHIVNLEEITKQFYAENEMLKHDQNLVKEFLKRAD